MNYYIIAGVMLALVIAFLALTSYLKKQRIIKLGKDGEKKVASALKKFAGIRSFKVINDLYLPLYDKTTQIDHILIGFFGLVVFETKNVSGEIYGDPKKKEWLHIMGKDKQIRHELYNPLMQNQTHIDCVRHHLGLENIYNIPIESLVVFTSKKVQLYIPNKLPIVTMKKLKKFLRQARLEKDNNIDVDKVYNALISHQVTDKKLIDSHVKNVKIMKKNNK